LKGGSPQILFYFILRGIKQNKKKRKQNKKEVESKTSKGGLPAPPLKKTAVELGDRTGDRIESLTFFCVS
jgi:hypothetical protein